jgi:hypothetical protein
MTPAQLTLLDFLFLAGMMALPLGCGLFLLGMGMEAVKEATEAFHRRKMQTFDKRIALEKARHGSPG